MWKHPLARSIALIQLAAVRVCELDNKHCEVTMSLITFYAVDWHIFQKQWLFSCASDFCRVQIPGGSINLEMPGKVLLSLSNEQL